MSMDGNFYGIQFSQVNIDDLTLRELKTSFMKYLPADAPGKKADKLDPRVMKKDRMKNNE